MSATVERLDWRDHAACRSVSPDLFFDVENEKPAAREMRERNAKSVCASCPVSGLDGPCAKWAIRTGDTWSISGGLTAEERANARRAAGRIMHGERQRAAIEAAGEKPCTGVCGETLPLGAFSLSKEGWRGDCKGCRNAKLRRQRRDREQVAS